MNGTGGHRIFTTSLASVYPLYLAKVVKKCRTKDERELASARLINPTSAANEDPPNDS